SLQLIDDISEKILKIAELGSFFDKQNQYKFTDVEKKVQEPKSKLDPVGTNVDFLLLPRLKEFQIEDELGQGGYGTVYQAFHVPTSTKCCIKILFQPNKAE